MRKKFTTRPAEEVTLTHGEEALSLVVRPLPPGWAAWLRTAFSPPETFVNGKPLEKETAEYNDLYGMLLIAKGLEGEAIIETPMVAPWRTTAEKLRDEFRDAGFTDGDLQQLLSALGRVNQSRPRPGSAVRGN